MKRFMQLGLIRVGYSICATSSILAATIVSINFEGRDGTSSGTPYTSRPRAEFSGFGWCCPGDLLE